MCVYTVLTIYIHIHTHKIENMLYTSMQFCVLPFSLKELDYMDYIISSLQLSLSLCHLYISAILYVYHKYLSISLCISLFHEAIFLNNGITEYIIRF